MNKLDSEKVTEHIPTHKSLGFKKFFFLQLQYFQYYQMKVLYHFKDDDRSIGKALK